MKPYEMPRMTMVELRMVDIVAVSPTSGDDESGANPDWGSYMAEDLSNSEN